MTNKKNLLIAIIIFFIIILGLYIFINKNKQDDTTQINQQSFFENIFTTLIKKDIDSGLLNNIETQPSLLTEDYFRKIDDDIIGDSIFLVKNSSTTSDILVFLDKKTGNIYSKTKYESKYRISNTIIPNTVDIIGGQDKDQTIHIYVKSRPYNSSETYTHIEYKSQISTSTVTSISNKINSNIHSITLNPQQNTLFAWEYINNKHIGYLTNFKTEDRVLIASFGYKNWISQWINDETISLTTKPSSKLSGYTYFLDIESKSLKSIIKDKKGLVTLVSPSGTYMLITFNQDGLIISGIYNTKTKKLEQISDLLFPNLCIWAKNPETLYCAAPTNIPNNMNYPEDLYQGKIGLINYKLLNINPMSGVKILLPTPSHLNTLPNVSSLVIDQAQKTLYMVSNNNLYQYDLLP